MPTPNELASLVGRIAIGQHWKSTTTGYAIAAAILAYYFLAVWHKGTPIDFNWIVLAATAAAGGRVSRDKQRPRKHPPTGPSAASGFVIPEHLVWLALGCAMAIMLLSSLGCSLTTSGAMEKVNGGFDATDGKVLGIIPAKTVASATDSVGLTGFRRFEEQLEDMKKLYQSVPAGTDLIVGIRRISTREPLPWDDLEMTAEMKWSSKVVLPVPDAGSRATLRLLTPVPPAAPTNAAPAANPPSASGGTTTNTVHPLHGPNNAGVEQ